MAFKMRPGSPMQRNFGIGGSPVEQRDVNTQIAKDESRMASERSPARQNNESDSTDYSSMSDAELAALSEKQLEVNVHPMDNPVVTKVKAELKKRYEAGTLNKKDDE